MYAFEDINGKQLLPGDYIIYPVQHGHVVNIRYARIRKLALNDSGDRYISIIAVRKAYWNDSLRTYATALIRNDHIVKVNINEVPQYILDVFRGE